MYLSDPIVSITYETGNTYVASIEQQSDKIRVFWEDDETDLTEQTTVSDEAFECFTVFDARDETGEYYSLDELTEKVRTLITAHKLEAEAATVQQTHTYEATKYPPR